MAESSEQVRVITTIGHVDHGKTTFVDGLLVANNIISARMAGKIRYLDSREDEQQRGITMESSAVSLKFKMLKKGGAEENYVINLIDTPGHVDFSSEVSTAARLCDGALVLVDVVEGVSTQTIAVLHQAYIDRLRPILVINKVDRLITELKLTPMEAYHQLAQLIEQVNAVMGSFFAGDRMEDDLRWREERERRLAERKERDQDQAAGSNAATPGVATPSEPGEKEDGDLIFQEKDDEDLYFLPERGNVIFASAIDGWGFRVGKFAQLYAEKLGIKESNLRRVLWGDFYLDPKTKRVIGYKHLRGRNLKPLFVQFVLENIWAVYENIVLNPNPEKVAKIVTTLNLKISPRDLKSKDSRFLLNLVVSQWLSLSTCTFQAVVDVIPPPSTAQKLRIPKMLHPELQYDRGTGVEPTNKLEADLYGCNQSEDAITVAYVSKMFAVPRAELPENRKRSLTAEEMRAKGREARAARATAGLDGVVNSVPLEPNTPVPSEPSGTDPNIPVAAEAAPISSTNEEEESEVLLGFARLYSGSIKKGSQLYCVLPKYNRAKPPSHPSNAKHISVINVKALYVMMGRELVPVETIQAGNVFAIAGLHGVVWRNGTLCAMRGGETSLEVASADQHRECFVNLAGISGQMAPIVRVALEPTEPADMPKLVKGLKLLSQADPCVETFQQQTGEHMILTAGELHLERCLKDLRERFAQVEIQASPPIVPFRETAVDAKDMPPSKTPGARRGTISGSTPQNVVNFTIRAVPLPASITSFLQTNVSVLRKLHREGYFAGNRNKASSSASQQTGGDEQNDDLEAATAGEMLVKPSVKVEDFWPTLEKVCKEAGGIWVDIVDKIWSFGPQRVGPNLLLDAMGGSHGTSLRRQVQRLARQKEDQRRVVSTPDVGPTPEGSVTGGTKFTRDFDDYIETGFQIATFQGPLCAEPMQGMAYFVESVHLTTESGVNDNLQLRMGQITGSLISAVKDACRAGLLDWSPRLMLAMYTCDIQAPTDVLGKVYGVVARRRGRIVAEEIKEGSIFFTVRSLLPVIESFGFADDIRKRTSGAASPQLIFSGYEMLDEDPFWVPTTEEELEDLGEKADRANIARGYMDAVRKRKGLFVEKKTIEFAEKQRTLKK